MQQADQKLKRVERLKSQKEIGNLFESGNKIHCQPFQVLYKLYSNNNKEFPAKIAISVSKKNFKNAVDRNHLKRKIRESYRKNKQGLYAELIKNDQNISFFVIYTANKELDFTVINEAMLELLEMITKKLKS